MSIIKVLLYIQSVFTEWPSDDNDYEILDDKERYLTMWMKLEPNDPALLRRDGNDPIMGMLVQTKYFQIALSITFSEHIFVNHLFHSQ